MLLFAYGGAALLLAEFLRKQLPFLQRLMIPNAFVAGLIVLLCSEQVLGIMKISLDQLTTVVYHLLTGIFILVGLRGARRKQKRAVFTMTAMIGLGYTLLAVIGSIFTLLWIGVLFKNFPAPFSMLPLLGFGFDHITATNIGLQWEQAGFIGGRYAGFSFGAFGFFWAYLGGTIMIYWARKKQGKKSLAAPAFSRDSRGGSAPWVSEKPADGRPTTSPEGLNSLALHLALIGSLYLLTFSSMNYLAALLGRLGDQGQFIGGILWNYNFLFGLLLGYLARKIIDWLNLGYLFDSGTMQRISGTAIDFMIVASLAAVPLLIHADYWAEVVILSLLSGLAVAFFSYFFSRSVHAEHHLTRAAAVFGYLTGTIASGVALLRMVDPGFDTPAAEELAWAGGLALLIGLPFFAFINIPLYGLIGRPLRYLLITLGLFAVHGLLLFLVWFIWHRRATNP